MNEKIRLLIIDDDEIGSKPLQRLLQKRELDVHYVSSGNNIISKIQGEKYDIIFLDMNMPEVSGHDVLKEIRKHFSQLEQPVIMLSGNDNVQDIVESFKLGANDYIVKPANIEIAMARIKTQIMLSEYYKMTIKKKELEAIHSMVITYSHEINNPMTIAVAHLNKLTNELPPHPSFDKLENSLQRVIDIITKIKKISEGEMELEYDSYTPSGGKMLKLKTNIK